MHQLNDLCLEQLGNLYHVENLLLKSLPKMAESAQSSDLKELFESHLVETKRQAARLQRVFKFFRQEARERKCDAMLAILLEGKRTMEKYKNSPILDAALLCLAQKVEHFEIVTYETLIAWAKGLEHDEMVEMLQQSLAEEQSAAKRLKHLVSEAIELATAESSTVPA